jgi:hypothetical protein
MLMPNRPVNDPKKSRLVWAKSPIQGRDYDKLILHPETFLLCERLGATHKMGQYSGLIHGNMQGKDKDDDGTSGLLEPNAIFRDIERDVNNGSGENYYVFVTSPNKNYRFLINDCGLANELIRINVPRTKVFLTYVQYESEIVNKLIRECGYTTHEGIVGVIQDWEWVLYCDEAPHLPANYGTRFGEMVFPLTS